MSTAVATPTRPAAVVHRRRRPASAWPARAATLAVVLGSAIRVEQFAWRRSLWLDEALIAQNIVSRSFGGLTRPLSGQQGAPIGWLWLQRAAVLVLGNNEYALRAVPLLAGLAALPLVYYLTRRILGPWSAALATVLLAAAPSALRYSVEVKQYSSDMAIALVVLALATRAADDRAGPGTRWLWGAIGAVAVWCSHPAVFVLAATAAVLAVNALVRRAGREARQIVAASTLWLASFGIDYAVSLRHLGHNGFLRSYWAPGLAPRPFAVASWVPWLGRAAVRLLVNPVALPLPLLSALVVAAGLAWCVRRSPVNGSLIAVPVAVGFGAASVGAFPLEGRMALWLLPVALIGVVAAATWVAATINRALYTDHAAHRQAGHGLRWEGAVVALCAVIALGQSPARQVSGVAHDPTTWIDLRPLLQAVHPLARASDQVWVHSDDAPSAAYYAISTGVASTAVLYDTVAPGACQGDPRLAGVAAARRVWFVYGYSPSTATVDEPAVINARLGSMAHLVGSLHRPHATAWLYDFAVPPASEPGSVPGQLGCIGLVRTPTPVATGLRSGAFGGGRLT